MHKPFECCAKVLISVFKFYVFRHRRKLTQMQKRPRQLYMQLRRKQTAMKLGLLRLSRNWLLSLLHTLK